MITPIEVTTSVLKTLMEKGLVTLTHPTTQEALTLDHELAQKVINDVADPIYGAIKGINVHRGLEVPNATIQDVPPLVLTAPCPSLDEPWTEEKYAEFSAILDRYEEE